MLSPELSGESRANRSSLPLRIIMSDNTTKRVERGAKLLDEKLPGWDEQIKLKKLDMTSETQCILGQLYCGYLLGLNALGVNGLRYGFDGASGEELAKAWKDEVLDRKFQKRHSQALQP